MTRLFLPQGSHVVHERKEVEGLGMDCVVSGARVLVLRNVVLCVK
jgi:hypothetical protein